MKIVGYAGKDSSHQVQLILSGPNLNTLCSRR